MRAPLLTLVYVFCVLIAQTPRAAAQGGCAVSYVANAGVMFETAGRKFLFDAPIREGISPYATPSAEQRARLEGAMAPFDGVTAILITHWHEDHFSAPAVAAHLRSNPQSVVVSSREVIARVRDAAGTGIAPERLIGVTPSPGAWQRVVVDEVPVNVLRIRHNPARRLPLEHVGFVVEGCRTVLHSGDADPAADNFTVLGALPQIDVALLPFWYVQSESNRRFVTTAIRPARVLAIHIPPPDGTGISSRLATVPYVMPLTTQGMRVPLHTKR